MQSAKLIQTDKSGKFTATVFVRNVVKIAKIVPKNTE